jgi:hypothetical protein
MRRLGMPPPNMPSATRMAARRMIIALCEASLEAGFSVPLAQLNRLAHAIVLTNSSPDVDDPVEAENLRWVRVIIADLKEQQQVWPRLLASQREKEEATRRAVRETVNRHAAEEKA